MAFDLVWDLTIPEYESDEDIPKQENNLYKLESLQVAQVFKMLKLLLSLLFN